DVLVRSRRRTAARPPENPDTSPNPAAEIGTTEVPQGTHLAAEEELRRQMLAYAQRHDMQTGLLNYQAFQESLAWLLKEGGSEQETALVWIDVLNLRREFSLWGSAGTDALVRHIADALRNTAEADAVVGRFSGRCFLVALRGPKFDGRT